MTRHFLLTYDLADDHAERRGPYRAAHLALAWAAHERGALIQAGGCEGSPGLAALFFQGPDASVAEDFARADPYVTSGLVRGWRVREWHTVVGPDAADPTRPETTT